MPTAHVAKHQNPIADQYKPVRIAYLPISLFSIIMGLTGLAIAWQKINITTINSDSIAMSLGIISSLIFCLLIIIYSVKLFLYPEQVSAELKHPIKINFFPTISISLLLLSVFWQQQSIIAFSLWAIGTVLQLSFTLFIMNSWIHHQHFEVKHINPGWFIPVVGNIIVPISGSYFAYTELSWFFFSIGILYWLVLLTMVMYRLFFHETLSQHLVPTLFILLAPPSIGFISYTGLTEGLDNTARILYYSALFLAMLLSLNSLRFWRLPFFVSSWAFSFPIASLTIATIKMASLSQNDGFKIFAYVLLTLLSIIVIWLSIRTVIAIKHKSICVVS